MLITDGDPRGVEDVVEKTIAEAQKIKDKRVLVIGLGVGNVNMATLQAISSPGEAVKATFETIDTKIKQLVAGSCKTIAPGTGMIAALHPLYYKFLC